MAELTIPLPTWEEPYTTELLIKRSRFLAQSCHVVGLAEGRAFVERIRQKYPDARHNCWACVGGAAGDIGHAASSDDGEPHGTAGRPMLQVLLHSGIGQICLVVTRWFGGIKLGCGGLVRAYQDSVRQNLEGLPCTTYQEEREIRLLIEYTALDVCLRLFPSFGVRILHNDYGTSVQFSLSVPKESVEPFVAAVTAATKGSCVFDW